MRRRGEEGGVASNRIRIRQQNKRKSKNERMNVGRRNNFIILFHQRKRKLSSQRVMNYGIGSSFIYIYMPNVCDHTRHQQRSQPHAKCIGNIVISGRNCRIWFLSGLKQRKKQKEKRKFLLPPLKMCSSDMAYTFGFGYTSFTCHTRENGITTHRIVATQRTNSLSEFRIPYTQTHTNRQWPTPRNTYLFSL